MPLPPFETDSFLTAEQLNTIVDKINELDEEVKRLGRRKAAVPEFASGLEFLPRKLHFFGREVSVSYPYTVRTKGTGHFKDVTTEVAVSSDDSSMIEIDGTTCTIKPKCGGTALVSGRLDDAGLDLKQDVHIELAAYEFSEDRFVRLVLFGNELTQDASPIAVAGRMAFRELVTVENSQLRLDAMADVDDVQIAADVLDAWGKGGRGAVLLFVDLDHLTEGDAFDFRIDVSGSGDEFSLLTPTQLQVTRGPDSLGVFVVQWVGSIASMSMLGGIRVVGYVDLVEQLGI